MPQTYNGRPTFPGELARPGGRPARPLIRGHSPADLDEHIQLLVDGFPALTDSQKIQLIALLRQQTPLPHAGQQACTAPTTGTPQSQHQPAGGSADASGDYSELPLMQDGYVPAAQRN